MKQSAHILDCRGAENKRTSLYYNVEIMRLHMNTNVQTYLWSGRTWCGKPALQSLKVC